MSERGNPQIQNPPRLLAFKKAELIHKAQSLKTRLSHNNNSESQLDSKTMDYHALPEFKARHDKQAESEADSKIIDSHTAKPALKRG